jgi:Spy/CpxP family protein refolding chaperone
MNRPLVSRKWIAAIVIAAATVTAGAAAAGGHGFGMHHRHGGNHENIAKHIEKMVSHVLPNGTPEQKAKLSEIAKACAADVKPLHQQLREGHKQALQILTQPTVDRAALEAVRTAQMQRMDQASRRMSQAAADAAEVLTPEQRTKFAEHLHKRFAKHH